MECYQGECFFTGQSPDGAWHIYTVGDDGVGERLYSVLQIDHGDHWYPSARALAYILLNALKVGMERAERVLVNEAAAQETDQAAPLPGTTRPDPVVPLVPLVPGASLGF